MPDFATNLTQHDAQRLEALEARVARLEKGAGVAAPEPVLSADQEAQLAAMTPYLSVEQLSDVRAKMLAGNAQA